MISFRIFIKILNCLEDRYLIKKLIIWKREKERVLGPLGTKGQDEQFHILWAGHGIEEATWEPGRRIRREIPHLVRSYLKRATEEEEQQRKDALELQRREETRRRTERKLARATARVERQGIRDIHRGPSYFAEQRNMANFGGYKD